MASAGYDNINIIRLWPRNQSNAGSYLDHLLVRNGNVLASGGGDDCVKLWDEKRGNFESTQAAEVNRVIQRVSKFDRERIYVLRDMFWDMF